MISDQLDKLKRVPRPKKGKDFVAIKAWEELDKQDEDISNVLVKNVNRVMITKSGDCTVYTLKGSSMEVEMGSTKIILEKNLVVYEDKEGIKNAWYILIDADRNRVFQKYIIRDREVLLT